MALITKDEAKLVQGFAENTKLFEAVKKIILQGLYDENGLLNLDVNKNWVVQLEDKDDAEYGRKARRLAQALFDLENAFMGMQDLAIKMAEGDKAEELAEETEGNTDDTK